jgi:hypothetical protein
MKAKCAHAMGWSHLVVEIPNCATQPTFDLTNYTVSKCNSEMDRTYMVIL